MPCTPEAVDILKKANVLMAPAVAAGAGGVRASPHHLVNHYMHSASAISKKEINENTRRILFL